MLCDGFKQKASCNIVWPVLNAAPSNVKETQQNLLELKKASTRVGRYEMVEEATTQHSDDAEASRGGRII